MIHHQYMNNRVELLVDLFDVPEMNVILNLFVELYFFVPFFFNM